MVYACRVVQAVDEDGRYLAVGNQGTELSIWDLQTQQRFYLAKGTKPNRIGLVDLASNTCVAFVPGTDGNKVCHRTNFLSVLEDL